MKDVYVVLKTETSNSGTLMSSSVTAVVPHELLGQAIEHIENELSQLGEFEGGFNEEGFGLWIYDQNDYQITFNVTRHSVVF